MRSLEGRLLAAVALLALATVLGVAMAARHGARRELTTYLALERRASRDDVSRALRELAAAHPGGLLAGDLQAAAGHFPPGGVALLVDAHGRLLAASGEAVGGMTVSTRRAGEDLVVTMGAAGGGGQMLRELRLRGGGVPVQALGGKAWLLPILLPSERASRQSAAVLGALDRRLLAVTATAAALALLLTWALARRILAPVRQLQEAARDLARGRLDRRVQAAGPEEIADLGRAFNGMAAELERQQRLRRDLVNDVAHELRAPLTAMLCRLDAAQDGLEPDPAAALAGLHGDVLHLASLVEDLQELALAEAGRLRLNRGRSSLAAAVASALRTVGIERDARLRLDVAGELDVLADPIRLRQILVNLLTNAVRHTPGEGLIRIWAFAAGDEVRVEVADSGGGLTAGQLARVFERFYRTDAARQRETGGCGLGLAIVKALVAAQGGRVWARSVPGEGATFGFALPVPRAGERPEAAEGDEDDEDESGAAGV
jgi:signal transduction histidine kinase